MVPGESGASRKIHSTIRMIGPCDSCLHAILREALEFLRL